MLKHGQTRQLKHRIANTQNITDSVSQTPKLYAKSEVSGFKIISTFAKNWSNKGRN